MEISDLTPKNSKGKVITYNICINLVLKVTCSITTICINVHKHPCIFIDMEVKLKNN